MVKIEVVSPYQRLARQATIQTRAFPVNIHPDPINPHQNVHEHNHVEYNLFIEVKNNEGWGSGTLHLGLVRDCLGNCAFAFFSSVLPFTRAVLLFMLIFKNQQLSKLCRTGHQDTQRL